MELVHKNEKKELSLRLLSSKVNRSWWFWLRSQGQGKIYWTVSSRQENQESPTEKSRTLKTF